MFRVFLLLLVFFLPVALPAQVSSDSLPVREPVDTIVVPDSLQVVTLADSVVYRPLRDTSWEIQGAAISGSESFTWEVLRRHPYFDFRTMAKSFAVPEIPRKVQGKEALFYFLVWLLILLGILRQSFPKYFADLFRVFFRTTLKQSQISEQLIQTPLPSLALNLFFVLVAGLYLVFLLEHFRLNPLNGFWPLFAACAGGLSVAYLVKFAGIRLAGWLFQMRESAQAYVFIVFIINKMLGILLLPLVIILAFGEQAVYQAGLTLSWCLVGGMLLYRISLSFGAIRKEIRVNLFHFVLYVAGFEILPLLLLYKALLVYFPLTA